MPTRLLRSGAGRHSALFGWLRRPPSWPDILSHLANQASRIEAQVKASGRVLAPHARASKP
jgi:hypothetical protein